MSGQLVGEMLDAAEAGHYSMEASMLLASGNAA